MTKNEGDSWYFKLACGHLRFLSRKKIKVTYGETSVYCKKCDSFSTVLSRAERW